MTLSRPHLTERVIIRATPDQLRLWVRLANLERRPLAAWIRLVLDRECGVAGELTTVKSADDASVEDEKGG